MGEGGGLQRAWMLRALNSRVSCAIALLFLVSTLLGCSSSARADEQSRVGLTGWKYRVGDSPRNAVGKLTWLEQPEPEKWIDIAPGERLYRSAATSKRLWLKTRIPEGDFRDPALMLDPLLTQYECYLNGELIDRHGDLEDPQEIWHGLTWRLVRLPRGAAGQEIVLRVRSTHWLVGVQGHAYVGSVAAHQRAILKRDLGRTIGAAVAFIVGISLLLIAAFSRAGRRLQLLAGAYALGACGYTLYYTKLRTLLYDRPLFWDDVYRIGMHASMIAILAFVCELFGPGWRGILRKLWRVHIAAFGSFTAFVYLFGYRSALAVQWVMFQGIVELLFRPLIGVEVVALVVVVCGRALKGDTDARIFALGILAPVVFTVRDVLAFFGVVRFEWDSMTFIGTLSVISAMVVIVQRRREARLVALSNAVDASARERSQLLKDLHDGIGGITTNIRFLAESAVGPVPPDRQLRAIQDIAELSKEGLAEMRSLLNSLDERDLSWSQLVKQLRHIGNQLLGPHGIELTLTSELHPDAPAPGSRACANVLRTYQEAVNNVFKHARASHVHVMVVVRPSSFELSVADDGVGIGGEGTRPSSSGLGLRNMHGRARELGGELAVSSEPDGTTVCLQFPLSPPEPDLPSAFASQ